MLIKFFRLHPKAELPYHGTSGAAGFDLRAVWRKYDALCDVWEYGFGLAVEIPVGYYGWLTNRSSIKNYGQVMLPGIIDADFRGEFRALFRTINPDMPKYEVGDRVAQLIISPAAAYTCQFASSLSSTERGEAGFGSTGR